MTLLIVAVTALLVLTGWASFPLLVQVLAEELDPDDWHTDPATDPEGAPRPGSLPPAGPARIRSARGGGLHQAAAWFADRRDPHRRRRPRR